MRWCPRHRRCPGPDGGDQVRGCSPRRPTGRTSTRPRSGWPVGRCRSGCTSWSTSGPQWATTSPGASGTPTRRAIVARLIGASAADVALILSVSSTAGLVAAQFGPAEAGRNVVIREREYCFNHFPWRRLARLGYDVRQVPFRNGGIEPEDVARLVDSGTGLVPSAACRPRPGTDPISPRSAGSPARWGRSSSSTGRSSSGRSTLPTTSLPWTCWWCRTTSSCCTPAAAWGTATWPPPCNGRSRRSTRAGGPAPSRSRASPGHR